MPPSERAKDVSDRHRRGFIGAFAAVGSTIAGCLGLRKTQAPESDVPKYTTEGVEFSGLMLKEAGAGGARVGMIVNETEGVEKVATPTLRFIDVEHEGLLTQRPSIELDPGETKHWSMGFVFVDTDLRLQNGDTLVAQCADMVFSTEVRA